MRDGLLRLLLLPVRLPLQLLRLLWRAWGRAGLAVRRLLTQFVKLVWKWILAPPWLFLGRMGLALRNLLTIFIWRPIRFMGMPWWLLYHRYVQRHVKRAFRAVLRIFGGLLRRATGVAIWLFVRPVRLLAHQLRRQWQNGQIRRARRRREWRTRTRVWQARMRVALLRPQPPRKAIVAPAVPRFAESPPPRRRITRLATTVLAIALVVVASAITAQQAPRLRGAAAENAYQISSSKFVTVTPTRPVPAASPTPAPSPTPWPTPDPLNGGGSVAFTLRQQGNSDLYALSIGKSQPVRLTNDPAEERDPAWSPDGSELAFASRQDGNWEIYVMRLEDGDIRRLTYDTAFDGGPSWSPDGQWLVFESYRTGSLDLFLISRDGEQGPIRLTQHPAPDFAPTWSPDGRHIAFTSWRSGNKDIYILSLDDAADSAARNVTGTPRQAEDNPSFSPDGKYLAYDDDSSGRHLVYALPLADYAPAGEAISHGQGKHPSWSPDGKALTFIHNSGGQYHLIASSLDAWSVAPQSFTTPAQLDDPHWSAHVLPQPLPEALEVVSQSPSAPLYREGVAPEEANGPPVLLREIPVNAPAPYLSDRVDQSFLALRQRVTHESGWDFLGELDQMYEAIDAQPSPGQSSQTWNKAGRAFDYLSDYALAFDPNIVIVPEREEAATYWRTYLKAKEQDGTQGEPLRDQPWDFRARFGPEPRYYDQGGKLFEQVPVGYYVDFTALATDYGWTWSPANDNWRTYFPGIRFWHYENRQELTWEQAMLELHSADALLSVFRR
jgi:TolB protein